MAVIPDAVQNMATRLLACLCDAVNARPNPPANCCFRTGDQIAADADLYSDLCCEGLAYVSLGDIYPADDLNARSQTATRATARACPFPAWAAVLRMGIIRCSPVGTDTTMPTCDDWNSSAAQMFIDSAAIREAACCFRSYWYNVGDIGMDVLIDRQATAPPEGGCVERYGTVIAQFTNLEAQCAVC